ncbi:MAG: hypothetical protein KC733_05515 [Candidatus Omnitrophica bacterium]|nr:hypothetical protein [Candidatus Omnitrophota bacterium]
MFTLQDRKKLKLFSSFALSMTLSGMLFFWGTLGFFIYNCKTKAFGQINILYIYAGISAGFAFAFSGIIMMRYARIINKYLKGVNKL